MAGCEETTVMAVLELSRARIVMVTSQMMKYLNKLHMQWTFCSRGTQMTSMFWSLTMRAHTLSVLRMPFLLSACRETQNTGESLFLLVTQPARYSTFPMANHRPRQNRWLTRHSMANTNLFISLLITQFILTPSHECPRFFKSIITHISI